MAVLCRGGSRLPLLLHRRALMSLQQLGSRPGGAEESLRLHMQETAYSQVKTLTGEMTPCDGPFGGFQLRKCVF